MCRAVLHGDTIDSLQFIIYPKTSFYISLKKYRHLEMDGLKDKVEEILKKCEKVGTPQEDIKNAFNQKFAGEIMVGDSDDSNSEKSFLKHVSDEHTIESERTMRRDSSSSQSSQSSSMKKVKHMTDRERMELEIASIRANLSGQAFMLKNVEVLDHGIRFKATKEHHEETSDGEISLID